MGGGDAEALTGEGARVHRGIGDGDAEILGVQTMYCWGDGKEAQSISTCHMRTAHCTVKLVVRGHSTVHFIVDYVSKFERLPMYIGFLSREVGCSNRPLSAHDKFYGGF